MGKRKAAKKNTNSPGATTKSAAPVSASSVPVQISIQDFSIFGLPTDGIVEHVAKIEKGVSYPAIRDSDVRAIQMRYPPLAEQRQIASLLTAVQRAIEWQERLITLTAELKEALMHKLFAEGTRGRS